MSGVLHDMHLQMRHRARAGAAALDRMSHNTVSYRGLDDLVMAIFLDLCFFQRDGDWPLPPANGFSFCCSNYVCHTLLALLLLSVHSHSTSSGTGC